MKVQAVLLTIAFFGVALSAETQQQQQRRGTEEYGSSTAKPVATGPETQAYTQSKYQQPSYVFQTKAQTYQPAQQLNYVLPQTYKFLPQAPSAPTQVSYVPQQQQTVQYAPTQNVGYNEQSAVKSLTVPQKISYAQTQPQPTAQPVQYSLAGDVSSFKYQSPFVSYSNNGVIQQTLGKSSQTESPRQQYSQAAQIPPEASSHQAPESVPQQIYTPQPQYVYRPKVQIPQVTQYTSAPQVSHITTPQVQPPIPKYYYSQGPQTFQVKQPQIVYQAAPKQAASVHQQFAYAVPQQVAYSPVQYQYQQQQQPVQSAHSVAQPVYVIAPQYQGGAQYQSLQYQQQ